MSRVLNHTIKHLTEIISSISIPFKSTFMPLSVVFTWCDYFVAKGFAFVANFKSHGNIRRPIVADITSYPSIALCKQCLVCWSWNIRLQIKRIKNNSLNQLEFTFIYLTPVILYFIQYFLQFTAANTFICIIAVVNNLQYSRIDHYFC